MPNACCAPAGSTTLQFEYSDAYVTARVFLKDIIDYIRTMNDRLQLYKILPTRLVPIPRYTVELENFMLSNWLFTSQPMRDSYQLSR